MADIDRLVEALAEETTPVTAVSHPVMLTLKWLGAALAYLALALLISGPRPDLLQALHQPWFVAELLALALMLTGTAFSTALLAFPDLYQRRGVVNVPALSAVLFVVVLFIAWHQDVPPAPAPLHSFECTLSIALGSVLPAAWMFYALRRCASTHPRLAGANILLAAFSVAALWLRLHEVNDSISHVIDWHYLPMLGVGAAGLWLGKVLLRW